MVETSECVKATFPAFFLFGICFLIFDNFPSSMTLYQSMQCLIPGRKTYNQIELVSPGQGDMFFKVSGLQVFDVYEFCLVLLPSTV